MLEVYALVVLRFSISAPCSVVGLKHNFDCHFCLQCFVVAILLMAPELQDLCKIGATSNV
jgi:hypothetical protein